VTTGNDTTNLDICLRIRDEFEDGKGRSRIIVAPELRAYSLAQRLAIHSGGVLGTERVEVRVFNTHATAGRALARLDLFKHCPRLHCAAPAVAIVGLGDTGMEILRQIVQTIYAAPGQCVDVLVIDMSADADARIDAQFPALRELAHLTCLTMEVAETTTRSQLERVLGDRISAVIVCLPDDQASLSAALAIRDYLDRKGRIGAPVLVRTAKRPKLGRLASAVEANALLPNRMVPFGDVDFLIAPLVDAHDELDTLAKAAHAIYRGESAAIADWSGLPERYKESNRAYVDRLPFSLEAIGIRVIRKEGAPLLVLEEPEIEALAEAEHWRWCIERRLNGWSYGSERDEFRMSHPALMPWEKLDDTIRGENRRRAAQVPQLFRAAGYELCRQEVVLWNGEKSALDRRVCTRNKPGYRVILADAANVGLRAQLAQLERSPDCSVIVALSAASMRELSRGRIPRTLAEVVRSPAVDQVFTADELGAMGEKSFLA
jgi:Trk K+ transport system NAD-binding subunit